MVKKLTKQYETPSEGWSEERIQEEDQLMEEYGLKNKREIYKAQSELRAFRREARKLASSDDEERRKEIIGKANRLGLIREDGGLEEILTLNVTDILDRRLQSAVNRRGYSDTAKEARQLVNHGHVFVDGQKVNVPGYMLTQEEEKEVEVKLPEPTQEEETETETEEAEEETEDTEESEEQEEGEEQ
ncbi:30S ribosomal protein S4 [Candidatus Nanohaloarchaea archaeon]|nr:30S ribosomal protein S4 [Candidatus Nanohaloarchaea archaeon]